MRNCEEECRHAYKCSRVWPDNDGGLWCNRNGFCIDGRRRKRGTKGKDVRVNEAFMKVQQSKPSL